MLRFDAVGRAAVAGHTVTKPGPVAAVAVTFMTMATAPLAGTPPRPATTRRIEPFDGTIPGPPWPVPSRVSSRRVGVRGTKRDAPGAAEPEMEARAGATAGTE